ncbi:MAG: extracellular solute-binding protein [Rhodospirillum sp.]|nr:extracellular solute-binding protein [Rhodospirillum sp.]MCF8488221.1 extracellular solute-binding protein [Rhodospirillum sp.]MCF8502518.1 extracellular solute-binding protein [Rhodospirillum sp.]
MLVGGLLGLGCLLWPTASLRAETLTFWVSETAPDFVAGTAYLLNAFMALNPDLTVQLVSMDESGVVDRLRAAWRAGEEPQLLLAPTEALLALGREGILDGFMAGQLIDRIGRDRFYRGPLRLLDDARGQGQVAIPYYAWLQGVWYRADWFAEAGLAPPDNLVDLLAAAQALGDPDRGRYGLLLGTAGDAYTTQVFSQIALVMGVALIDGKKGVTIDTPEMARALTFYRDLARTGPPGHMTPTGRDYYFQDRLAMMFYSTHIMDDLALSSAAAGSLTNRNFPELPGAVFNPELLPNTGMIPSLHESSVAAFGVTMALGIPYPATRAKAAAVTRLVRFLFRDDVLINWMHKAPGGMMPVLRDMAVQEAFLRDPMGVFARWGRATVDHIVVALDNMRSLAQVEGRPNDEAARILTSGLIGEMVRQVVDGVRGPAEAAAWGQRAALRLGNGESFARK